jgi:type I restriction-modification system DNA methylase subunit
MNMILHNNPEALIHQGNTLTDPKYKDQSGRRTASVKVTKARKAHTVWPR